jgi:hypothetical protein
MPVSWRSCRVEVLGGGLMVEHIRGQDYDEYLRGNSWRCSNSPTGAHYWIVGNQIVCKYCLMVKQSQTVQLGRDIVIHPATSNLKA